MLGKIKRRAKRIHPAEWVLAATLLLHLPNSHVPWWLDAIAVALTVAAFAVRLVD